MEGHPGRHVVTALQDERIMEVDILMLIVIMLFVDITTHETGERDVYSSSGSEDYGGTNCHNEDNVKAPDSDIGDTSELEDKGTS